MKLCVLVTSMNQTDLSLYKKMKLQSDAVIANQCERNEIVEDIIDGHRVKMISTDTKGLSINRNIAYEHLYSNTDFLMFSDDDVVYEDNYEKLIEDEFRRHPEAQAIKFNLKDLSQKRKITMKTITKYGRATIYNMSSSGVCGAVFKRKPLENVNVKFHENFGSGKENYSGEDSIFLNQVIKKIKFYRSPTVIAGIDQSESTWFVGVTEKNLRVRGMVSAINHPVMCYAFSAVGAFREVRRKRCDMTFFKIYTCYLDGISAVKKGEY